MNLSVLSAEQRVLSEGPQRQTLIEKNILKIFVRNILIEGALRNNCLMFDLISRVRFFLGVRVLLGYNSLLAARGFK